MTGINRRNFLQGSLASGAFLVGCGSPETPELNATNSHRNTETKNESVKAATDEISLAIIGLGGRGGEHVKQFRSLPGVNIVALVDPDVKRREAHLKNFPKAKGYADLRKMLEDESIDAVSIASCNHWHCLAAIWAMQAGKHVYVEKPLSHNQWEGRQVVKAARKYKKIVQLGTQQRSSPIQDQAKKFLHVDKTLGEIQYVQVCRYGIRSSIGKRKTPLPIPKNVDYDLWLGPAEDQELFREKFHYDWHWDWNTGSGEMGNWGVHVLDDVRNVVFQDQITLPKRIVTGGGRLAWKDAGNTPNVHFAYFDTGKIPTYIGLSNLPAKPGTKKALSFRGVSTGYFVQCEGGHYAGRRGGGDAYDANGKKIRSFKGSSGNSHAQNFIDAIRANDSSILKAEIKVGHDSTGWCNLANIGFRAGSTFHLEQAKEINPNDANWNALLAQMTEHFKTHGYKPADTSIHLSPVLHHNPETEQFTGEYSEAANKFLTRQYRKGYEVKTNV